MSEFVTSRDPIIRAAQMASERNRAQLMSSFADGGGEAPPVRMRMGSNGQQVNMALDPNSVHVNAPLENFSVMYHNREMIADMILPVIRVKKLSDLFFKYDPTMNFTLAKTDVGSDMGRVGEISPILSTQPYTATRHGLRDYVPQSTLDNADDPLQPLIDTTVNLNAVLRLARENRVATAVFSAGNYGSNTVTLSGGTQWSASTGTPVTNIITWIQLCTMYPNIAAIGEQAYSAFINNPEVKSFITARAATALGAVPFFMDAETLGRAFRLPRGLHVGAAKYNSAPEGEAASIQNSYIWGKNFALLHEPETLGHRTVAFGATLRFVGSLNVAGIETSGEFNTRSWFEQWKGWMGAHVVQVSHADAELIIDTTGATGYLGVAVSA